MMVGLVLDGIEAWSIGWEGRGAFRKFLRVGWGL